jgi:hypothetical protein
LHKPIETRDIFGTNSLQSEQGIFLLQTGKGIAPNSDLRMSVCWCEADSAARMIAK